MPLEGKRGRGVMRSFSLIAGMASALILGSVSLSATELPPPPGGPIYEAIVLDAETGQILRALNPDTVTYPASLTKMMTLYLTFEALNQGRIRIDQYFPVSQAAAEHRPSKLGLRPGQQVMVRDLILGIVTKSANDAAAVLAEGLGGGSEPAFAEMMTQKARQLGMTRTTYRNASGLPDPGQLTTARDIARLALALIHDFPREYRYFSIKEFAFNGRIVNGHDHLLDTYPGTDGIKTGYTVASGFNLATSAVRDGHRLIGVILGGESGHIRDGEMQTLLDLGFGDLARQAPVMMAQHTAPPAPIMVAAQTAPSAAEPETAPVPAQPARPAPSIASIAAASMAGPATTPAAQPAVAAQAAPEPEHPSTIGAVASAAISHLAPVSRAEAAPVAASEAGEAWGIQIGAYRDAIAAERAEHRLDHLAVADGKESVILAPSERGRLYRLRLMHFSARAAHAACEELHRQGIACTVVPPAGLKVASR